MSGSIIDREGWGSMCSIFMLACMEQLFHVNWFMHPGTGAFIPCAHAPRPGGAVYVPPPLRDGADQRWRTSNPLAGKSLDKAVTLCHVLHSKVTQQASYKVHDKAAAM